MADKFCPNCQRMVGTKKNLVPGSITIVIGILLILFIPFAWFIGVPVVLIGILILIFGGHRCPICGSSRLSKNPPNTNNG